MTFDIFELWSHMGALSKAIALSLAIMAIASAGVVFERLLAFRRSAKESRLFAQKAAPLIDEWAIEELTPLAQSFKHSTLARLFAGVTERYLRGRENLASGMSPVEMARNEAVRQRDALGAELRRGMSVLASVGSVAPFVGLLGTVMGIISAFKGIGTTGSGGLAAVSIGISEALAETALGLLVAIPAVLCFNYLSARVNGMELLLERSAGELLDEMENHHGRKPSERAKPQAA
jgi:biopolymer transport protein ExbB